MPDHLLPPDTPPDATVDPWHMWAWRAWHRMSLDRPYLGGGMGALIPGRIPWHDVYAWSAEHGEDRDMLDAIVMAMDSVFIEHMAAKNG